MNQANLTGRLTKDLELRKTETGLSVVGFTLAVQRDKENADFINCVAWNKTAEHMAKYLKKGSKVLVEGRISTRTYESQNGKVYITEVVANRVEFLENKQEEIKQTTPQEDDFSNTPKIDINGDELPFY